MVKILKMKLKTICINMKANSQLWNPFNNVLLLNAII